MNSEELQGLKRLIVSVASYYSRQITPEAVSMMANDLSSYEYAEVTRAYATYRQHDRSMRFPMPSAIIALINPEADERALAVEAASRVIAAVSKHGWCNGRAARAYVGELGWRAVERMGGWTYLCENLGTELQVGMVQAQVRDVCESTLKLGHVEVHDEPVGLPASEGKRGLESMGEILNRLSPKRPDDENDK